MPSRKNNAATRNPYRYLSVACAPGKLRLHLALEPLDGLGQAFFQIDDRFPAKLFPGAGNIGPALLGIVHGQRQKSQLTLRAGDANNPLGEFLDCQFVRVANVDRFMEVALGKLENTIDQIGDETKAARLRCV